MKAAVARGLGKTDLAGVHVAIQGVGSVGGGLARHLATAGARLTLADKDADRARALRDLKRIGYYRLSGYAYVLRRPGTGPQLPGARPRSDDVARTRERTVRQRDAAGGSRPERFL